MTKYIKVFVKVNEMHISNRNRECKKDNENGQQYLFCTIKLCICG